MDRPFPKFRSNYPSNLKTLAEYAAEELQAADGKQRSALLWQEQRHRRPASAGSRLSRPTPSFRIADTSRRPSALQVVEDATSAVPPSPLHSARSARSAGPDIAQIVQSRIAAARSYSHVYTFDAEDEVEFNLEQLDVVLGKHINLRSLSFARSYATLPVLQLIPKHCPYLVELNLSSTYPSPARAIAQAIVACPLLRVLHLSRNDHLFQDTYAVKCIFSAIARPASLIQDLRLARNASMTDAVLMCLRRVPGPDEPRLGVQQPKPGSAARHKAAAKSGKKEGPPAPVLEAPRDTEERLADVDIWFTDNVAAAASIDVPAGGAGSGAGAGDGAEDTGSDDVDGPATDDSGAGGDGGDDDIFVDSACLPLPLVCLDLSHCTGITDRSLIQLARSCPNLQQLRLQLCDQPSITPAAVIAFGKHCPRLTSIDLTSCARIDAPAIRALATGCPDLLSIVLAGCKLVNDTGVVAIQANCTNIVSLDLSLCNLVTFSSVHQLAVGCRTLRFLNLTMCPGISDENMRFVAQLRPELKVARLHTAYTAQDHASLVPGFRPPPHSSQWSSVHKTSTWKKPKGAKGKGKKGKKGKKK